MVGEPAATETPAVADHAIVDMPHFTERCRPGSVLAASASTRSAMPRCGCGSLPMYARTGLSPTAAFSELPCRSWRPEALAE